MCDVRLSLSGEGTAFEQQASSAVLDLMGDEGDRLNQHKNIMKWLKLDSILSIIFLSFLISCSSFLPFSVINKCLLLIGIVRGSVLSKRQGRRTRRRKRSKQIMVRSSLTRKTRRTCIPSMNFVFHYMYCCAVDLFMYHLTTFQLWGMEEEIQDWRCRVRQRNGRRGATTSR